MIYLHDYCNAASIECQEFNEMCIRDRDIASLEPGMHFVCTPERDAVLRGYGCRFTLFLLVKGAECVAAYSPKHSQWMEPMKAYLPETLIAELNRRNTLEKMQLMLDVYKRQYQVDTDTVYTQLIPELNEIRLKALINEILGDEVMVYIDEDVKYLSLIHI